MLDERTLELLPEAICRRLSKLNKEILEAVGKSVKEIGKLSKRELEKLNRARLYSTLDIEKELERITGKNARDIAEILERSAQSTLRDTEFLYDKSGIKYIKYQDNIILQRYVEAIRRQTLSEYVNLSQNTAFCIWDKNGKTVPTSLSETYNRIIDEAVTAAQTGVTDYNGAIRQSLRALADSGLRTVDYATGYSKRLDSAVRQNVLWGIKQCNQGVLDQVGEEIGADGCEIDYHSNPRPTHAVMGGMTYSSGEARIIDGVYYPPFSDVEELLADYNCLHFATPVILGVSEPSYTPEVLAALKERDRQKFTFEGKEYTGYEATQIQRRLESAIRKQKDRSVLFAASGDDTVRRTAQEKINALTEKYAEFSKAANLPTKKERLSVAGYRKVGTDRIYAIKGKSAISFGKLYGEKPLTKQLEKELSDEYVRFTEIFGETPISELLVKGYRNDGVWGSFTPNGKSLILYGIGGSEGKTVMTQIAKKMKKEGKWSTASPFHAFRHELGHAWFENMKNNDANFETKSNEVQKVYNDALENLNNFFAGDIIEAEKNTLSIYGLEKRKILDEFVAECVAEYVNGKPRNIAKKVIKILLN